MGKEGSIIPFNKRSNDWKKLTMKYAASVLLRSIQDQPAHADLDKWHQLWPTMTNIIDRQMHNAKSTGAKLLPHLSGKMLPNLAYAEWESVAFWDSHNQYWVLNDKPNPLEGDWWCVTDHWSLRLNLGLRVFHFALPSEVRQELKAKSVCEIELTKFNAK